MRGNKKSLLTDAQLTDFKYQPPCPETIDWPAFLSLPGIELWKGIALICGIDPSNPESSDPILAVAAFGHGYQKRLNLAIDHIRIPDGLLEVKVHSPEGRPHLTIVTLQSLIKLAQINRWAIPEGLKPPTQVLQAGRKQKSRRPHPMHAPVMLAYQRTPEPKTPARIWATLCKIAETSATDDPVLIDFVPKKGDESASIRYWDAQGKEQGYTESAFYAKLAREGLGE